MIDRIKAADLAAFLRDYEEMPQKKADAAANALMLKLVDLPGVRAICTNEKVRDSRNLRDTRNSCRCREHGYMSGGEWIYRSRTAPWVCTAESLLKLSPASINLLGSKSRPRMRAFIRNLQRQK